MLGLIFWIYIVQDVSVRIEGIQHGTDISQGKILLQTLVDISSSKDKGEGGRRPQCISQRQEASCAVGSHPRGMCPGISGVSAAGSVGDDLRSLTVLLPSALAFRPDELRRPMESRPC